MVSDAVNSDDARLLTEERQCAQDTECRLEQSDMPDELRCEQETEDQAVDV